MPLELWGAADSITISFPQRPLEYFLLLLYVSLFAYLLYLRRRHFRQLSAQDWYLILGLSAAGLFTSQLFPIPLTFNQSTCTAFSRSQSNYSFSAVCCCPAHVCDHIGQSGRGDRGWHGHRVRGLIRTNT